MFKNVTSLLLLITSLLSADINLNPLSAQVLGVDKQFVIINNIPQIPLGTTGVVMHAFDSQHKAIVSQVEVVKKEDDKMVLLQQAFNGIPQQVLPSYKIAPAVGDEVILNFLYQRALAIVPNKETYDMVQKSFQELQWLHPDIFAAKLAKAYHPTPDKKAIQSICQEQNIGLLLIAVGDKGHFVDCHSFKSLDTIALPVATSVTMPFYNRLEPIKGRIFGLFGGKGVKNYDAFYSKLLK